jgi:hypothetical protein
MGKEINDFDDQNELRPTHNNLKDLDDSFEVLNAEIQNTI